MNDESLSPHGKTIVRAIKRVAGALVALLFVTNAYAQRAPGTGRTAATYNIWRYDDPRFNGRTYSDGAILIQSYERRPKSMLLRAGKLRPIEAGHPVAILVAGKWLALDHLYAGEPTRLKTAWSLWRYDEGREGPMEFAYPDKWLQERIGGNGYYDNVVIRTPDRGEIMADAFAMEYRRNCETCDVVAFAVFRWFFLGEWFAEYWPDRSVALFPCDSGPIVVPCVVPVRTTFVKAEEEDSAVDR